MESKKLSLGIDERKNPYRVAWPQSWKILIMLSDSKSKENEIEGKCMLLKSTYFPIRKQIEVTLIYPKLNSWILLASKYNIIFSVLILGFDTRVSKSSSHDSLKKLIDSGNANTIIVSARAPLCNYWNQKVSWPGRHNSPLESTQHIWAPSLFFFSERASRTWLCSLSKRIALGWRQSWVGSVLSCLLTLSRFQATHQGLCDGHPEIAASRLGRWSHSSYSSQSFEVAKDPWNWHPGMNPLWIHHQITISFKSQALVLYVFCGPEDPRLIIGSSFTVRSTL